jgi:hypothetical protein
VSQTEERVAVSAYGVAERGPSETLPFSRPFDAPKSGKRQQGAAQAKLEKSMDSTGDDARSGNVQ